MRFIQQGDVTIKEFTGTLDGLKKLNHKRLAEGEATGHAHVAVAEDVILYATEDGHLLMHAPTGTEVVHEEHGTVRVPAGDWEIGQVQEYDHFEEEARAVQD